MVRILALLTLSLGAAAVDDVAALVLLQVGVRTDTSDINRTIAVQFAAIAPDATPALTRRPIVSHHSTKGVRKGRTEDLRYFFSAKSKVGMNRSRGERRMRPHRQSAQRVSTVKTMPWAQYAQEQRLASMDGSKVHVGRGSPQKVNSQTGGEIVVTFESDLPSGADPQCLITSHPQGWEFTDYLSPDCARDGSRTLRCHIPAFPGADGLVHMRIGRGEFEDNVVDIEYVNPLVASFDQSPYFNASEGQLLVRVDDSGSWSSKSLKIRAYLSGKVIVDHSINTAKKTHHKIKVDFHNLDATFNSAIQVQLIDYHEHVLANQSTQLVRLPELRRGRVAVDHMRRSLIVDGRPFLPISWFTSLEHGTESTVADLQEMARRGVNSVMIYNLIPAYSKMKFKRGEPLPWVVLDACVTLGIKVHAYVLDLADPLTSNFDTKSNEYVALGEAITAIKEHPAILSWYVADDNSGEDLPRVYEYIRELDPYHPVSIAVSAPRQQNLDKYVKGADLIMTETYPADGDSSYRIMKVSEHWPTLFKPSITCGRAWTLEEDGAVISREVFRSQLYHALIGGATGEVWFRYHEAKGWNNPGVPLLEESGQLAREMLEIVPSIISSGPWDQEEALPAIRTISRHQNGTVARSEEAMRARAFREASGMVTLLVANGRNEPMQAEVKFGWGSKGIYDIHTDCTEAQVPLEVSSWKPRRVQVCGGVVQEWLPAWGVQMFRFNGTSQQATEALPSYPRSLQTLMSMSEDANILERKQNLVVNPSFETSSSFISAPDGWFCGMADAPKGQPDSSCFADSSVRYSGRHSGRFVTGANPFLFRMRPSTWQNADSYAGTLSNGRYKGSVWASADQSMDLIAVRIWANTAGDTESPLEEELARVTIDGGWSQLEFNLDIQDKGQHSAGLQLAFKASRPGVVWLDDVELYAE